MKRIRWANVPIPEGHIALLLLGVGLHLWRPRRLFQTSQAGRRLAWPLLLSGSFLAGWAVAAAQDQDIQKPSRLVTTGPYAYTRNPMYLAWNMIYVAAALLANSAWLLALLPALIFFTHFYAIKPEERYLDRQFGETYRRYCARVRRYL
jgi:protein-S-isoprenylcysteine O-methyltransferase Ste14